MHTPWHLVSLEEEVNNCWLQWKDLFQAAVDDCIPKVNVKRNKTLHAPWISKELILLCRKKKTSYKKAKKSGKDCDWNYYKKLNAMVKRDYNSAWWSYVNKLSEELAGNNPKAFWKYVNSKRKGTNDLILLKVGDKEVTDDMKIAERMNTYFSTVFTKETFDIFPTMSRVMEEKLCDIQCSVDEVEQYLNNINVSKSPGPDNILPRILKQCASAIAPSLASIFNRS
jgi:hypothetical protein